jgi:hypothetical protein
VSVDDLDLAGADADAYVRNSALGERVRRRWARPPRRHQLRARRAPARREGAAARARVRRAAARWQDEVHTDPSRFRVVVAGRRSGKTYLMVLECVLAAAETPNALCWYVGPRTASRRTWRGRR